ncbi:EAL domain-containing protein [Ureibacillus chungkukjangi]|uniref:bifunctional diguanylate cyclase/phosphodiesterase n=1 Tax=Ureibacillus chungkukjangi TaxID=1202712 RepID=UPI00203B11A1|nr:EAL domain-containing protein [Ureibacillus chungkukjangi]MCM3390385.1 EAL domain-containing protein [Ureibacillus chungkukjangi]
MNSANNNHDLTFEIYKSLFEYNPDAMYAVLPDGKFTLVNEAACKLVDYTREELIGISFEEVIAPDFLEKTRFHFNEAVKGNNGNFQSVLINKNGERIEVLIVIVPIIVNNTIEGIIGVTKDITEQMILETLKQGQNRILEMITKNKPFQTVLDNITTLFEGISNTGGKCSIMLMDESRTKLSPVSAPSLPTEYVDILDKNQIWENKGSCGTAAFTKQTIIVEDTQSNPLWEKYKEVALQFNIMSCWSIPLLDDKDNVLGTFAIYYDKCHFSNENDIRILNEASYLAGIAVQHYQTKERINYLAFHDSLTELPNRRMFEGKVSNALEISKQTQHKFSILFIDLDRFKNINDTYGHNLGDELLIEVSKRLRKCVKEKDVIARLGGDEFTILLENASSEIATQVADRIVDVFEEKFILENIECYITPSIGITVYPTHGKNVSELLKYADGAMYQSKKEGGNQYSFHIPSREHINKERFTHEYHLRKALENNEFILHYQPKINLSTNRIVGVEALIRWNNSELGMVQPDEFIPIAEETGLIIPIGGWVIRKACEQLIYWKEEGLDEFTIAVNISIRQFYKPNFISQFKKIIDETGINPSLLELEVTESMTMDVELAKKILDELKTLGVKVSIDDFGTGFSSFNYLKHFPLDSVKIDRSFVSDITHNHQSETLVKIIFLMAKTIGFKVVAEGVETKEQLEILKKLNCDEVQGYFFSKPLPQLEFERYLEQFNQDKSI